MKFKLKKSGSFNIALASLVITSFLYILIILPGCKKEGDKINESVLNDEMETARARGQMDKIDLKLIADNLVSPLGVIALPGKDDDHDDEEDDRTKSNSNAGDKRLFIIDQVGKIWIIDKHGVRLPIPFLDVTSRMVALNPGFDERGLLGFAFHPNYRHNGRFFVYYNAPRRAGGPQPGVLWNNLARISEFRVSSNPNLADMGSERVLLELDDPQSNHNGGTIAFGPDNYLYIAIGDGGAANDNAPGHVPDWYLVNAGGNGQDVEANLFGNILRIDVNRGNPYAIPRDNPFVNRTGRDEIYAYGFRNPYRFSFDMGGSHQLIAGDAGQILYEEIDVVKKGANYGWNVKEGRHCFSTATPGIELPSCPSVDPFGNQLIDPVIEMNNWRHPQGGRSTTVIGGNVYRGNSIHSLKGKYIFASFSQNFSAPNGELFMANVSGNSNWQFEELTLNSSPNDIGYFIKGFGQDQKGEVYVTVSSVVGPTGVTGKVFKLVKVGDDEDEDENEDD